MEEVNNYQQNTWCFVFSDSWQFHKFISHILETKDENWVGYLQLNPGE